MYTIYIGPLRPALIYYDYLCPGSKSEKRVKTARAHEKPTLYVVSFYEQNAST